MVKMNLKNIDSYLNKNKRTVWFSLKEYKQLKKTIIKKLTEKTNVRRHESSSIDSL